MICIFHDVCHDSFIIDILFSSSNILKNLFSQKLTSFNVKLHWEAWTPQKSKPHWIEMNFLLIWSSPVNIHIVEIKSHKSTNQYLQYAFHWMKNNYYWFVTIQNSYYYPTFEKRYIPCSTNTSLTELKLALYYLLLLLPTLFGHGHGFVCVMCEYDSKILYWYEMLLHIKRINNFIPL